MSCEKRIKLEFVNEKYLNEIKLPVIYLFFRRIFDIFTIIIISPIILLLCLITAVGIKLTSPGPILFIQNRPGKNNSIIKVFKFRTMHFTDESVIKPITHNDSDVTGLGKFLRKHRIDEIPQLFNVLIGDMSIIGPRPEPYTYYKKCTESNPLYRYKFRLKPGITGWAQVWYNHTDDIEGAFQKFEYDIYYMKNVGFRNDLIIFFRTFRVIFFGTGAK